MTADAAAAGPPRPRRRRFWDVLAALGRPRVTLMLLMGISSGLPFMLIGNTLGFWLADDGIKLAAIGSLAWVGLTYSYQVRLGRDGGPHRRCRCSAGWGAGAAGCCSRQVVAGGGLIGMGFAIPRPSSAGWSSCADVGAVGAATQDTAMDAWRIETAADADELGLLTAAYTLGYRFALILTELVILMSAKRIGWPISYVIYGAAMAIGMVAVLLAKEPAPPTR